MHVTLPALRPVITSITSLNFIWNFNSFGLVYVLTEGGPGGKTMLPMLFAYNEAFKYGDFALRRGDGQRDGPGRRGAADVLPADPGPSGARLMAVVRTRPAARGAQYVALAGYMVFLGFPLFYLLMASLKSPQQLASLDVWIFPRSLHWVELHRGAGQPGPRAGDG